jgi:hypothetical protein
MTKGTARFRLEGEDATAAAFRSALGRAESFSKQASAAMRVGFGLVLGDKVKQGFRAVVQATAQSEAGARSFGKALDEVKRAAGDLLAAKSGLPAATKAMEELRDTLKDPSIVTAADAFTSTLISGFGKLASVAADAVGDIRQIALMIGAAEPETRQELIDELDRKIAAKREELRSVNDLQIGPDGLPVLGLPGRTPEQTEALQAEIALLEKRQQLLIEYRATGAQLRRRASGSVADRERRMTGLGSAIPDAIELWQQRSGRGGGASSTSGRSFADIQAEIYDDLAGDTRRDIERTMDDINRESQRGLDELHGRWEKWKEATGETIGELSPFADQAARNMQDAFADFLFDPFEGGIKGMLKSFVDILRRMVAEAAAAKIFEALGFGQKGGGGGFGGIGNVLGGVIDGITGIGGPIRIPGRAAGGPVTGGFPYIVGERGPELFVPRSSGNILPNGAGGASIVINNYMDNRGATTDFIAAMPEILRRNNAQVREEIIEGLRRGRY